MRKVYASIGILLLSMGLIIGLMLCAPAEKSVAARIVTVQRGDVHQVAAITGRLVFAQEEYILAPNTGVVSNVYVVPGQRVGAGEALIRCNAEAIEGILASAIYADSIIEKETAEKENFKTQTFDNTVIRAEKPVIVREVFVEKDLPVTMGAPVLRVSSGQQQIRCAVAMKDAEEIAPGMWAWLSAEGESLGFAEVIAVEAIKADSATGQAFIPVVLQPEQHIELPEGTAVDAEVFLRGSDDVMTLPVEAVTARQTVWWVTGGRCTEIPANVVLCDEIRAWVALPEGLQVAVGEYAEGQHVREADE